MARVLRALSRVSFTLRKRPYAGAGGVPMLHYALIFFVVALVAAVLGMRGVAGLSANIGYTLLVIAVIFVAIALLTGRAVVPGP